jgi:salicylate hydroxylase
MRNRPLYDFDAEADTLQRWHGVSSGVAEELRTGQITPLFSSNGVKRFQANVGMAQAT